MRTRNNNKQTKETTSQWTLAVAVPHPQKPSSRRKMCNFVKGTRTRTLTLGRASACFRLPPTKTMGDTGKPTIARRGGSKALGSSLVPISLLPVVCARQKRDMYTGSYCFTRLARRLAPRTQGGGVFS